jgi:hypothetical protein
VKPWGPVDLFWAKIGRTVFERTTLSQKAFSDFDKPKFLNTPKIICQTFFRRLLFYAKEFTTIKNNVTLLTQPNLTQPNLT